jgi:hypothetical protein
MSKTSCKELSCTANVRIYIDIRGNPIIVELDTEYIEKRNIQGVPSNTLPDNAAGYLLAEDIKVDLEYEYDPKLPSNVREITTRTKELIKFSLNDSVSIIVKSILQDTQDAVCPVYWIVKNSPECSGCIHCKICIDTLEKISKDKEDAKIIDTITDPASRITYPIVRGGMHEDG